MAERSLETYAQVALECSLCAVTENVFWFCEKCEGNICASCKDSHQKGKPVPLFKGHKVIPRLHAIKLRKVTHEKCVTHPSFRFIAYCTTCRKLVCMRCIAEQHKGHETAEIVAAVQEIERRLKEVCDKVRSNLLRQCYSEKTKIDECKKESQEWLSSVHAKVEKTREDMRKEVDNVCDNFLEMAATGKRQIDEALVDLEKSLDTKIDEISHFANTVELMDKIRNSEKVRLMKKSSNFENFGIPRAPEIDLSSFLKVSKIPEDISNQIVNVLDPLASRLPRKVEVKVFENEEVSKIDTPKETPLNPKRRSKSVDLTGTDVPMDVANESLMGVEYLHKQTYNFSIDTIVPAGKDRIAFGETDAKELNMIDTARGAVHASIKANFKIDNFDILYQSDDLICTDFYGQSVKRLSPAGRVTTFVKTPRHCPSGICMCNDNGSVAVAMSTAGCSKLVVYAFDSARVVQSIQYTHEWVDIFTTQRVAQNGNGDFCVADHYHNKVFIIAHKGLVKSTYDGTGVTQNFTPWDVCCDQYEQILISDTTNNTIHVLDHQGNLIVHLLSEKNSLKHPRGLGVAIGSKLLLGDQTGSLCVLKYTPNYVTKNINDKEEAGSKERKGCVVM